MVLCVNSNRLLLYSRVASTVSTRIWLTIFVFLIDLTGGITKPTCASPIPIGSDIITKTDGFLRLRVIFIKKENRAMFEKITGVTLIILGLASIPMHIWFPGKIRKLEKIYEV